MVNKNIFFSILILILLVNLIFLVNAEKFDVGEKLDKIGGKLGATDEVIGILTDPNQSGDYLANFGKNTINNSFLAKPFGLVGNGFRMLNPLWENILGMKSSFSLLFVLTLFLFGGFLFLSYDLSSVIAIFSPLKFESLLKYGGAIFLIFIISFFKISRIISILVVTFLLEKGSFWAQFLGGIVAFVLIFFLVIFSGTLRRTFVGVQKDKSIKSSRRGIKEIKKQGVKDKKQRNNLARIVASNKLENMKRTKREIEAKNLEAKAEDALGGIGSSDE